MNEDYSSLNRVYFPNLDIKKFNNDEKKIIEEDIAKDFEDGLIGIRMLDKNANFSTESLLKSMVIGHFWETRRH